MLFLDDTVFKVGLPLRIAHTSHAPHGLAPLLLLLNSVMVVALQIPLARFATTAAARALLIPLSAAFALGGITMALSADGGAATTKLRGLHGLAQSAQRSLGPLAVTAAIAAGPLGWTVFGTTIAVTCAFQHRPVRDRLRRTPLSVPPVTVSEH
ncbi:hypothetical protein [Streptomyces olivochromogenes]|uniref:hypothetical protein n=1 Tax=Streptomyces olivochromogenes TaxID=1963 RepID=UPI0027E4C4A2|nr:hypothetical protein [Streptomyces olivochromogenes]